LHEILHILQLSIFDGVKGDALLFSLPVSSDDEATDFSI
jgi:hypothetical protein